MRAMDTSPVEVRLEIRGLTKAFSARPARKGLFQDKPAAIATRARTESEMMRSGVRDFLLLVMAGTTTEVRCFSSTPAADEPLATSCEPKSERGRATRPEVVLRLRRLRSVCRSAVVR